MTSSSTSIHQGVVAIPPSHFLSRVKREYGDVLYALVREFIQNSVDARATRIDLDCDSGSLTVRDDGCGIPRGRLVSALLTLGGSAKDSHDSVGGFGLAKEILLFSHENYEVRTGSTLVKGRVLQYSIETMDAEFLGSLFSIKFSPGFGYTQERFMEVARRFLSTCCFRADVYLNGELLGTAQTARRIGVQFAHGTVRSRRLSGGATSDSIWVRVNGVTMFEHSVRTMDKQVIVDLDGDTRAMLTSNREWLRHPYSGDFTKVGTEIAIDPRSFDRLAPVQSVFKGKSGEFFDNVRATLARALCALSTERVAEIGDTIEDLLRRGIPVSGVISAALVEAGIKPGQDGAITLESFAELDPFFEKDFVVTTEGTTLRKIPKGLTPNSMLSSHLRTARIWRHCLERVMQVNEIHIQYRTGFVLDPEKLGLYLRAGRDLPPTILINPLLIAKIKDAKKRFMTILVLACHELGHRNEAYHDEKFVHAEEALLVNTLASLRPIAVELREAKRCHL